MGIDTFPLKNVKTIVLHRTDSGDAKSAISGMVNGGKGVHFVIEKDGSIQRIMDWDKGASHVGGTAPKYRFEFSYLKDFDTTGNNFTSTESMGIEVVGKYDPETGLFETPSPEQLKAVSQLVEALKIKFKLGDEAVVIHGLMSPKKFTEGLGLGYDRDKSRLTEKFIDKLNGHAKNFKDGNYKDAKAAKEIMKL
ncbi:MAG: N-acetylmuramoyl-L-alanine amidase [Saprospirales bacterium]|nr:N-acetylmuramoyl-L-alanine amidase [Saprospirales bacterium]